MLRQKLHAALCVPGERKSDRFFRLFPWIWLAAAYCITLLVFCLHGRGYIDSDMSSEMILADILNQEGGLLSTNWWYSTELRVFYVQIFYRLGLLLFPNDWFAARMLGQALMMLALVAAYLYVGRGLRLKNCGAWGAAALLCPFGGWYLWYVTFGGFYIPHMVLILLGFGTMLRLMRPAGRRRRLLQILFLLVISLMSGLNGVKGLMGFYLPMVVAALVAVGLQWHQEPQQCPRSERRLLAAALLAAAVAGVGYVLYSVVLAANHSFSDFNDRRWSELDLNLLFSKWADFLSLFGHPGGGIMSETVPLFSLNGVLSALGIVIAGAILFSLVRLLWRWKELDPVQRTAPLLLAAVLGVQGAVFAFTGSGSGGAAAHWLAVVPLVFPVLQLEGETEHFRVPHIRQVAALAFCFSFVATSVSSTRQYFSGGYPLSPHLEEVCDWLVENGYTRGCATFWNGNVLTEWSSGQIEMWVTNDFNTLEPYVWLQKTSHATLPEEPVFLLTTMEELHNMGLTQLYWWSNVVYEDGDDIDRDIRYVVMEYKSGDDMKAAVAGAQSWEAEGRT